MSKEEVKKKLEAKGGKFATYLGTVIGVVLLLAVAAVAIGVLGWAFRFMLSAFA